MLLMTRILNCQLFFWNHTHLLLLYALNSALYTLWLNAALYTQWLDGIADAMDMNLGKLQEMVRDKEGWRAAVHGLQRVGYDWVTEQQ